MSYILHIKYPKQESKDATSESVTNQTETFYDVETNDILERYESFIRQGYNVTVGFKSDDVIDNFDVFSAAETLDENGLEYSAKLKFLDKTNQGTYSYVKSLADIIEQKGFDYTIAIKLKIKEDSTVDFSKESTWFSENDALYTITPKASSKNILELKGLYDELSQIAQVMLNLKPKKPQEDTLALCIDNYPAETEITLTLKDAEY